VASCERCSGYLAELERLQQRAPSARATAERPRQRPARARVLALSLAALAALGAVTALLIVPLDPAAPNVGIKGSPSVQLLVRRGTETRTWDGASPVRAGDALGLRVVCEDFARVAVAAETDRERWSRLSEDACPAAGAALPFTLIVDEQPGTEHLAVAFSKSTLEARTLEQAIAARRLDAEVWVTRFELVKEASR
jgi:hypothetical protein